MMVRASLLCSVPGLVFWLLYCTYNTSKDTRLTYCCSCSICNLFCIANISIMYCCCIEDVYPLWFNMRYATVNHNNAYVTY